MYDIALREVEGNCGLTKVDVLDLFDMLNETEAYVVEFMAKFHESSAIGFITVKAADKLDYDYDDLEDFIASILDDVELESENCEYKFDGLKIWMSR